MSNIRYQELGIKPTTIKRCGKVDIITDNNKKYVIKKKRKDINHFEYLTSRNFTNFPQIYNIKDNNYYMMDYLEDTNTPIEQKIEDIMYLTSILHTKTTFYKNVDDDYIKEIYENQKDKLNSLYYYYNDLQNIIETEVYMSPGNYLLIRNISLIYQFIKRSNYYLDKWYSIIKEEKKLRFTYIHGNLNPNHLIESDDLYLISWDKSKIDLPIYDLEIFYRNSYNDTDLNILLSIYESKYPLKQDEYYLLLSLILIPDKINMNQDEYTKTTDITNLMIYLDKLRIYLENNSKETNYYHNHQE